MNFFVPTSAGFIAAVEDRTSTRYYRLYIDTDGDDVLEDVTTQLLNNQITGNATEGQGQTWQAVLRNVGGTYKEGDLAGAKCRVDAKCGDNEYITIFTGYVDRKGVNRQMTRTTDDKVTVKMYDYTKHSGENRKTGYYNFVNYTICDPSVTGSSIFHKLALDMGLTAGQLDVYATLDYQKDYLPLDGKNTAYKELQILAGGYLGKLNFRYDGKLRFNSPFMNGWVAPSSEWTFDDDNIHTLDGDGGKILCNYVETEFDYYEALDPRIIHKNLQLWNALFEYNEITVAAGEYWPGEAVEGKVATLKFKDPKTGEEYTLGINIRTPTIGAYSNGAETYDIECDGGLLTLHSFNGVSGTDASLTEREPNGAQIILKNDTASTVTIRRLTIWGQPLRILSKEMVKDYDNSVDDWDVIEKKVDGKYLASDTQAYLTCKWWNEFGQVARKRYTIMTDWLPQVQVGAIVTVDLSATVYPPDGIYDTFIVERYTHPAPNGVMGKAKTQLTLLEHLPFSGSGSPSSSRQVFTGLAAPESVDGLVSDINDRLTYTEAQEGYDSGGGTTTPTQVTIQVCQAQATKTVLIMWDQQLDLTNLDHYEIQVSDDNATWYSLEFDGSDWKGSLGALTEVEGTYLLHTGIPHTGTEESPTGRQLYYRVRRVTKAAVNGDWSVSATTTTKTVAAGDVAEAAIYANNVVTGFLNAIFAVINQYLLVSSTDGFIGQTYAGATIPYGAQRARLDQNELSIERYNGASWDVVVKLGGDENGGFFPYIQGRGLIAVGAATAINDLDIGHQVPDSSSSKYFNFDNDYQDQNTTDPWNIKSNLQFTTSSKFGTHALTSNSVTGVLKDNDAQGINFDKAFTIDAYKFMTEVSGVSGLKELVSLQTVDGINRPKEVSTDVFSTNILRNFDTCSLNATAVIYTYYDNSGGHYARAKLAIINGTAINDNSPVLLGDESVGGWTDIDVSITKLTNTRALCFWGPHQSGSYYGRYALISRLGATGLSIDATGTVYDGSGDDCGYPQVGTITPNKVLLVYRDVTPNQYKCSIGIINASFTDVSFYSGTQYANPGYVYRPCFSIMNTQYISIGQLSAMKIGEVGATSIDLSATTYALDTTVYDVSAVPLNDTHTAFFYRTATNSGNISLKVGTRSGRSLSFGPTSTRIDEAFGTDAVLPRLRELSAYKLFFPYYTSTYGLQGLFIDFDTSYAITSGAKVTYTHTTTNTLQFGVAPITDQAAFVAYARVTDYNGIQTIVAQRYTKASIDLGHKKLRFKVSNSADLATVSGDVTTPSGWNHLSLNFDGSNTLRYTMNAENDTLNLASMTPCTATVELQFNLLEGTFASRIDDLLINGTAQSPTYTESLSHYARGEGWTFDFDSQNDIIIAPKSGGKVYIAADTIIDGTSQSDNVNENLLPPIGAILAWHKNLTGTPALPSNFMECNGQAVTDSESPYYGETLPDLNGDARFLRGGATSGTEQTDAAQGHAHRVHAYLGNENTWNTSNPFTFRLSGGSYTNAVTKDNNTGSLITSYGGRIGLTNDTITDGTHGTPRISDETRPINMSVVWIIRIK